MDVEYENRSTLDQPRSSLEDDVGPEVYGELLTSFLSHLSLQRVELNDAAKNGHVEAAQYVAHQIKGTALSFGAFGLDELANRLLRIGVAEHDLMVPLVGEMDREIGALQEVDARGAGNG